MRIGFVEPHLNMYGGIRRIIELANNLTLRGHEVTVYHPEGRPCEWLECRAEVAETRDAMMRSHDALIYNDPDPASHRVVRRADARLKAFYLLALYQKEVLTGFHPLLWIMRNSRMAVTGRALRSTELILVNSTWMHLWVRDVLGIESRLVIGGLNREHFHPLDSDGGGDTSSQNGFRVLCSGDPRPHKGTSTIMEAARLAQRVEPRITLAQYHGEGVPQPEMARRYGSADLFIDAQQYAGWNNPVAEAMACGVPVVCTDIGGVQDFAFDGETALLVPPGDPERLSEAILRMTRDPQLRQRLRQNALDHIQRFTWKRSAQRMEAVLEEGLVRERPPLGRAARTWAVRQAHRAKTSLLGRGRHFDKYDRMGAYHWRAYHDGEDPVYRRHVDKVVELLGPGEGRTLLDVGCGDGLISAQLADAGFTVTGIDIEPTAIRIAAQQRPDVRFIQGDLYDIDETFDLVVASEVVEHLSEPEAFLSKIAGVSRRGALITTPDRDYYSDVDRYHRTEYGRYEYISLLKRHFPAVEVIATGGHLYGVVSAEELH